MSGIGVVAGSGNGFQDTPKRLEALAQLHAKLAAACHKAGIERIDGENVDDLRVGVCAIYKMEKALGLKHSMYGLQGQPQQLDLTELDDNMDIEEVDERLEELDQPTTGSERVRRRRLKVTLDALRLGIESEVA